MLINCPKCGFSQPQDRYCAKCGVDMEHFRPASDPLIKTLILNPLFFIGLTAAVVAMAVIFIKKQQSEELTKRAQLIRSGPLIVEQSRPEASDSSTPESPSTVLSNSASTADVAAAATSTPAPPSPSVTATPSPGASSNPTPIGSMSALPPAKTDDPKALSEARSSLTKEKKILLTSYFTDTNKQTFANLAEESSAHGQFTDFGDFKSGSVSNVKNRLGRANGVIVLQKIEKTFDQKTHEHKWFVGNKSADGQDVGLTLLVALEPLTDSHYRGEIEILRSLHESSEAEANVVKKSYPVNAFDLSPGWGWMVQLALPRIEQSPQEDLAPEGFMKLFSLGSFKKGDSEFTLFLDFDSREP